MRNGCTEMPARRRFLALAFLLALFPGAAFANGDGLRLAFIPQENPEKLLGDIATITAWLAETIDRPVKGFVTSDHAAAVEALRNRDADISFMGALPFVLAEAEIGAEALLSEIYRNAPQYRGRVFVRRDSGVKRLEDLKGRDIAFADPISESGYLLPLDLFVKAGLVAEGARGGAFFENVYFAGGYQQAMQAVAEGIVDAAAASQYADMLLTPAQQQEVTWIAESEPIPSHVVVARQGIDPGLRTAFMDAMLKLNRPENQQLLQYLYGPDGYQVTDPSAFAPVRRLAKRYGLLR